MLRFLLVAPIYAASLQTGGGQRTFHLYRALAKLGEVDLLLVSEPALAPLEAELPRLRSDYGAAAAIAIRRSTRQSPDAPAADAGMAARAAYLLRRAGEAIRPRSHFYRPTAEAADALAGSIAIRRYDAVVARYLKSAAVSGAFAQNKVPVIVDLDDLDEIVLESKMRSRTTSRARKAMLWHHAWQVRAIARRLRAQCRHLFTASEFDRALVDLPACSVLPNIPLRPGKPLAPAARSTSSVVLFVGTYPHLPNRDGMRHFVDACWPAIRHRVPQARLRIVGSGGWEAETGRMGGRPGVEIVGSVRDLDAEYAQAAVCVVPLLEGSGTKIKVLEALMYGRPVVTSPHSARGFEHLVGDGVVVGAGPAEMAAACTALIEEPATGLLAAERGRQRVARDYSQDAIDTCVERAVEAVLGSREAATAR